MKVRTWISIASVLIDVAVLLTAVATPIGATATLPPSSPEYAFHAFYRELVDFDVLSSLDLPAARWARKQQTLNAEEHLHFDACSQKMFDAYHLDKKAQTYAAAPATFALATATEKKARDLLGDVCVQADSYALTRNLPSQPGLHSPHVAASAAPCRSGGGLFHLDLRLSCVKLPGVLGSVRPSPRPDACAKSVYPLGCVRNIGARPGLAADGRDPCSASLFVPECGASRSAHGTVVSCFDVAEGERARYHSDVMCRVATTTSRTPASEDALQ